MAKIKRNRDFTDAVIAAQLLIAPVSAPRRSTPKPVPAPIEQVSGRPDPADWDVPDTRFNCFNCNAMCCSVYERVALQPPDIERLAGHFKLSRTAFCAAIPIASAPRFVLIARRMKCSAKPVRSAGCPLAGHIL